MRILIASEKDDHQAKLYQWLRTNGNEVYLANSYPAVIEQVYREMPDIILLSLTLPEGNVPDLLKRLKEAPSTRDIPVFIVTPRRWRRKLRQCYRLGATDYIITPYFLDEVLAKCENILRLRQAVKELEGSATTDFLTGLYNRRYFMTKLAEEISWAIGYHEPLTLLILDIDHFKKVNDTYGHSCGDEILKQVAKIVAESSASHYIPARLGGEEFVVLLPNTASDEAKNIGETLRVAVEEFPFVDINRDIGLRLTISIGMSTLNGWESKSSDTLLHEADTALYEAKQRGRNRLVIYSTPSPAVSQKDYGKSTACQV